MSHGVATLWRRSWLYILFFCSGVPALLYQLIWQRTLQTTYGTHIESVTIIVSAFMLGLGVGAFVGGRLSHLPRVPSLIVFSAAEFGIGLFGLNSLSFFDRVTLATTGASPLERGLVTFALLLVPTLLMGATLPLLVSHLAHVTRRVAGSVGALYFVNALGSAAACFMSVLFSMHWLGKSGSIRVAAVINLSIGLLALIHYAYERDRVAEPTPEPGTFRLRQGRAAEDAPAVPFWLAAAVTGSLGFVAMGYQVLWFRLYAFASGGSSRTFALLLGFFLIGIGAGAAAGGMFGARVKRLATAKRRLLFAAFLLGGNLCAFAVAPAASRAAVVFDHLYTLPLVTLAALMFGASFPTLVQLAVPDEHRRPSAQVGLLYLCNIFGATAGSFAIGYVLMERWRVVGIARFLVIAGAGLAFAVLLRARASVKWKARVALAGCVTISSAVWACGPLFDGMYERLLAKTDYVAGLRFTDVIENRSGVIAVTEDDTFYGGGVYDGRVNVDLVRDVNGIFRPYSLSLWHAAPRSVLMVGIGTGSWAQVVAHHPGVEQLTIVEINPGYLELIASRPTVAGVLRNPKVRVEIDSGRRWLLRHPDTRFDVVMMNTAIHWRANATNVLSTEFFVQTRAHLKPGGVLFYNATGAPEAERTGVTAFPYGLQVGSCLAVSDSPLAIDWERWKRTLRDYRIEGRPVFELERAEDAARFVEVTARGAGRSPGETIEDAEQIRARTSPSGVITDDNMGLEWRPPMLASVWRYLTGT
jgi:spermidine synthase